MCNLELEVSFEPKTQRITYYNKDMVSRKTTGNLDRIAKLERSCPEEVNLDKLNKIDNRLGHSM